jgi:hypothetical protein
MKRFSGQLGNHLFQANLLCQVADSFDAGLYFRSNLLHELFNFNVRVDFADLYRAKGIVTYSAAEVESLGFIEWTNAIGRDFKNRRLVNMGPGVLGSMFFESCVKNPTELISWKQPPNSIIGQTNVGIHFRAGDFKDWNPKAILPVSYYMKSLDYLESIGVDISKSYLATDDITHPTSIKIANRIGQILKSDSSLGHDFRTLSNSQYLVSSPSTFAFWAAILGNGVKIIHNREWLDQNEELGVKFWIDIRKNSKSFYNVIAEL